MGTWLDRLRERRARANTAKTDETPAETAREAAGGRVSSVLAVFERASGAEVGSVSLPVDPFADWHARNAERLSADDLANGYDAGGYCTKHRRVLSYPEQKRGA